MNFPTSLFEVVMTSSTKHSVKVNKMFCAESRESLSDVHFVIKSFAFPDFMKLFANHQGPPD